MNTVPTDFFQESAFVSHQDPTHLVFFEDVSLSKKKGKKILFLKSCLKHHKISKKKLSYLAE